MTYPVKFSRSVFRLLEGYILMLVFSCVFLFTSFFYVTPVLLIAFIFYIRRKFFHVAFEDRQLLVINDLFTGIRLSIKYDEIEKIIINRSVKLGSQAEDFIQIYIKDKEVQKYYFTDDEFTNVKLNFILENPTISALVYQVE